MDSIMGRNSMHLSPPHEAKPPTKPDDIYVLTKITGNTYIFHEDVR